MRIIRPFSVHLLGGAVLLAAGVPAVAQSAAPTAASGSEPASRQVIAVAAAKRATNLQRAPIAVTFFNAAAPQDHSVQRMRTVVAASN